MDQVLIQQQLKAGIQAVRQGDPARAEALLLEVVTADPGNEPAWLWLSRVVTAPADQLVALENALTLNPDNAEARARVEALRRQLGLDLPPAPSPPPPPPAAEPAPAALPAAPDDTFDNDPDQCLYCGKLTEPEAESCPYCHRSLLQAGRTEEGAVYRWLVLLSAAILQLSLLQPGLALGWTVLRSASVSAFISSAAFYAMLARFLLWLAGFFAILSSQTAAPVAALVTPLLDWGGLGLCVALGWFSPQLTTALAGMDLPSLILGASTLLGRAQARVRQRVVLDRDAHGHAEMYRRGWRYAQAGKWALAALHWQKAMVLKPAIAVYYKDLSTAQVRLGRYAQALRTLRAGADRWPDDPEFRARLAALEQNQAAPPP